MTPASILAVALKGISVAQTVWENRDLALGAINAVQTLISNKTPTKEDVANTEAELDALLDEFNSPLPPE